MCGHPGAFLDPAVQTKDMACTIVDYKNHHSTIHDVIIHYEVIGILDVWEVHVRHPVGDEQRDPCDAAQADHEANGAKSQCKLKARGPDLLGRDRHEVYSSFDEFSWSAAIVPASAPHPYPRLSAVCELDARCFES